MTLADIDIQNHGRGYVITSSSSYIYSKGLKEKFKHRKVERILLNGSALYIMLENEKKR